MDFKKAMEEVSWNILMMNFSVAKLSLDKAEVITTFVADVCTYELNQIYKDVINSNSTGKN